jgi:hypothetical protein
VNLRRVVPIALFVLAAVEFGVFKHTRSAGILFLLLAGAGGAALVWLRDQLFARVWAHAAAEARHAAVVENAVVALLVVLPSAVLFHDAWSHGGYSRYDWAPHHANLRHLIDGLASGHVPRWVQGVSTGDSPYELYPFLPYYLAARAALLFDARDLTLVLVRSGIVIHTLGAVGAALLARRVIGWKWGVLIGWVALLDLGSVFSGGLNGVLYLGVTHSALATALWTFVLVLVLDALERPSLANSAAIWLFAAFAIACHPIGVLAAAVTSGALLLVACLAEDVPRHRACVAFGHVALAVALAAFVWMPFSARILVHGMHYAWPADSGAHFFADLLEHSHPQATLAPLIVVGYVGIVVGLLSRRAAPTLVACHAAVALSGLVDQFYFLLDLLPSLETARLHTSRLESIAKPAVYVCAAYLLALVFARAARGWSGKERYLATAVVAVLAFPLVRSGVGYFGDLTHELAAETHPDVPDAAGFRALIAWARTQARTEQPDAYARLMSDDTERYYSVYHVNAETNLPSFWLRDTSALFLRERIEDASPASLARFDVRWVVHHGAPPGLGDPATERRFGSYYVRELPSWDGRFARVERGAGRAIVTRLDDERVDVELSDTSAPALVALGMGYYPRWQAEHATRGALPVYAYPVTPGSALSVPAAWLPPGHTTFRATGALPSDRDGRWLSALAFVVALASVVTWQLPRARARVRQLGARASRALTRRRGAFVGWAAAVGATTLVVASLFAAKHVTRALEVGTGLLPLAHVAERGSNGVFRECDYAWLVAQYRCPSGARVFDAETQLLTDAAPSPAFVSPAIRIEGAGNEHAYRVVLPARLEGEYWAQTNGPSASVTTDGAPPATVTWEQTALSYELADRPHDVTVSAVVDGGAAFDLTFVRRRTLDPQRHYPVAPAVSPSP